MSSKEAPDKRKECHLGTIDKLRYSNRVRYSKQATGEAGSVYHEPRVLTFPMLYLPNVE